MSWSSSDRRARPFRFSYSTGAGYITTHLGCLGVIWVGVSGTALALLATTYAVRVFGVMGGYHRYFSHRAFRTSRGMQLVLAVLGCLGAHRGVLWWASHHRRHHRYSDTPEDIFSPVQRSFLYAHSGWALDRNNAATDLTRVPDLAVYPELRWLDRWCLLPYVVSSALLCWAFGWTGFVWGVCASTVLNWHSVHCIGSFSHLRGGYRRYATADNSRNRPFFALLLLGEWHNNHHHYPASARLGFRWWELDPVYYALKLLARCGLVWDLRVVPEHVARGERGAGGARLAQLTRWQQELRMALAERFAEAAGELAERFAEAAGELADERAGTRAGQPGDEALHRLRHACDDRLDAGFLQILDLASADPTKLGAAYAETADAILDEIRRAPLDGALIARLTGAIAGELRRRQHDCPFRHFLTTPISLSSTRGTSP